MRQFIYFLRYNILLKVAGYNSIHIALRIVTGAVMSWVIANFVGAAGMGIMGNVRNFVQGVQSVAVLGLENGLVKNTAQHKNSKEKLVQILGTGWWLACMATLVCMIAIFIAAPWLDKTLIATDYSFVTLFRVFAGTLPFWVFFVFMTAILQGFEHYKKFITLNIITGLIVFAVSAYLMYNYNLIGALYSLVLTPVVQCVVSLFFYKYALGEIGLKTLIKFDLDASSSKLLLRFSIMALVSAILLPLVTILVRDHLRLTVSDEAAGWWEAVVRIASYYMMFVTSLISLYMLPRLSTSDSISNYRTTIVAFYKVIIPLVIAGLIVVYLLRDFIIAFLFSAEFEPASSLFKWQLAGDFLKVITTVLAFRFIAVNDLKRYLIAEFISVLCFYTAATLLVNNYGVEGVVMAHLVTYAVYLVTLLILLRKELWG